MGDLTTLANVKAWLGLKGQPITAITRANPGVVTCPLHNLQSNVQVAFSGINGMTQLNGQTVTITVVDPNTFSIGIDTTGYGAWTSGGLIGVDDALLQRVITGLSAGIQSVLSRVFAQTTYNEVRNGTGKTEMMVLNDPIISITSVTVDNVAIAPRAQPGSAGYTFDNDTIYLDGYCFSKMSRQNVVLVYSGGFATLPADLDQDMCEAIGFLYRERDRIGMASKAMAGETTAFLRDLPPHLMRRFNQYNRPFRPPT
jgi:hypothetical protein